MNKNAFTTKLKSLQQQHAKLLHRKNRPQKNGNGIFDRYENPVLTAEHTPLTWRYDFNRATNPHLMTRLGVNCVFNVGAMEGALRDGARNLNELRQSIGQAIDGETAEMSREIDKLLQEIRDIDPRQLKGNPELLEKLRTQLLPKLEHLELSLRRQVDDTVKGQVRTPASDKVPAGYAQAVADYFRKLSSGK